MPAICQAKMGSLGLLLSSSSSLLCRVNFVFWLCLILHALKVEIFLPYWMWCLGLMEANILWYLFGTFFPGYCILCPQRHSRHQSTPILHVEAESALLWGLCLEPSAQSTGRWGLCLSSGRSWVITEFNRGLWIIIMKENRKYWCLIHHSEEGKFWWLNF
jgi:hypothetical protein